MKFTSIIVSTVTTCSEVETYRRFGRTFCLYFQGVGRAVFAVCFLLSICSAYSPTLKMKAIILPKRWRTSTRRYGVTSQKAVLFKVIALLSGRSLVTLQSDMLPPSSGSKPISAFFLPFAVLTSFLTLKMEAVYSSETFANFYQTM
jgi:hypothetical protein